MMKCLIQLFREHVTAHPSSIALEDGTVPGVSKQVTYQELDERSDNLSLQLRQHGVRRGDMVPVLSTRCIGAIVALLAIHKLRACYVPIDLDTWGSDRIENTLGRVKARLVITTNRDTFSGCGDKEVIYIPHDGEVLASPPTPPDSPRDEDTPECDGEDWAYVIFTSGSTGNPKGVIINQRSISSLVTEQNSLPFNLHASVDSRVLLIFSFAFDACTYVIFSTLCNGATLVLASPTTLEDVAQTCHIWIATPSILGAMDPSRGYDKASLIMVGGENPTPFLVDSWSAEHRRLINIYGPTEATCTVLMYEMRPGEPIAMGVPISFCTVLLVDDEGNEAADEGEMLLGGPGVAVGYYEDEVLTRAAFIERGGERFYRTKDHARRTPHGLVFCGRKDAVVKNRGFLVNLESEVEPALLACSEAKGAAAVSCRGALVGFVTPRREADGLRDRLLARHSAFLVPDVIYGLDAFPSTGNGKVDRKALTALHERTQLPQFITPEVFLQGVRDAGKELTPLEAVRHAVCMVLRIVQARVDDGASFRALGGHSLAAVMLVSTLRKLGFHTDVVSVFSLDTVSAIAAAVRTIEPDHGGDDTCFDHDRTRFAEKLGPASSQAADVAPATDMQVRMVRGTLDDPSLNFIKIGLSFDHGTDSTFPESLRAAWEQLSRRHSILQSSFHLSSSEPLQVMHKQAEVRWQEVVVSSEEAWQKMADVSRKIEPEELTSFDEQDQNALSRVQVVLLPGVRCRLVWTVHHSLVDGWSASVILNDLGELLHGRDLPPCPQFSDAAWCMRRLIQRNSQAAKAFWKDQLGDVEDIPRLRVPPPEDVTCKSLSERHRKLSIKLTELEAAAKTYGVTTAALVYGAWAVVLSRYCDSQKVVLGTVLSGRSLPLGGVEKIVGPLINSLPMSVMIQENATVPDFLRQVFKSMCQLLDFQWTPNSLVQEATGRKGTDYFDTLLAIQYDFPEHQWPGARLAAPYDISIAETTEMPLTVMVDAAEGCLDVRFVFRPSNFGESMVERMIGHFENVLRLLSHESVQVENGAADSVGKVAEKMLSEEELHASLNCTDYIDEPYEGPETLSDAFELSLSQYPSYRAVEGLDRSLTYSQLDSETARVTQALLEHGIKAGDIVCVIADGSVNWLLAIMSVVRTGAAYCPIDNKFPLERQSYMMSLCQPPVVLYPSAALRQGHHGHEGALQLDVETILADAESEADGSSSDGWELAPKSRAGPNDLAVILFTSGTTGFPKAVQLEHKPILSVLSWGPTRLRSKPGQRNAQLLSLGFDCCVTEVFSSLLYGATLVLKDAADPLAHLSKVDAIVATPSLVTNLNPADYPNLKVVTLMGEPLPVALAQRWMPGRILQNSYGPAETTLMTNAHPLRPDGPISVGKPIPRVAFYILDSMGRPVPTGVSGEIFVASQLQVTRGYRNNANETEFRFLRDPFRPGWRMFRSGDMGRWDEEGNTQIIGRTDSQVKLRGFRIDLGDIEATIARLAPSIDNVAVVVTGSALRAFVTPATADTRALMERLRAHCPEYSTPNNITALEELPLSPNGKVNRKELAKMHLSRDSVLEPLATDTERAVADAWAELLGRDQTQPPIGALDRFFDLGGHSLLQIRLAQKLSTLWNTSVPLRTIIRHQVLRELCRELDRDVTSIQTSANARTPFASMQQVLRQEKMPASYLEQEMVLNQMLCDGSPVWNIVYACKVYGAVDLNALGSAFQQTVARHEVLCSRFHNENGTIMRSLSDPLAPSHASCSEDKVDDFISQKMQQPLDPFTDSLIQLHAATVTPWKTVLVFVMSHIVGDGPTLYRVLHETSAAYTRITSGTPLPPAPSAQLSYLDWAHWALPDTTVDSETATFWQSTLSSRRPALPGPRLHSHHGKPLSATYRGDLCTWSVRPPLHRRLVRLALAHGLSMHQLALAATLLALRSLHPPSSSSSPSPAGSRTGSTVVALGAPMTLRTEPGTERMPGLFLDRLVIPLPWEGSDADDDTNDDSLSALFATVRERSSAALARFVPHRVLRQLLRNNRPVGGPCVDDDDDDDGENSPHPSLARPLVEVVVAFHTAAESAERRAGLTLHATGAETAATATAEVVEVGVEQGGGRPRGVAKFPVMVEFTDDGSDGGLRVELEWDDGVVERGVAERLEQALAGVLEMLGASSSSNRGGSGSVTAIVDAVRGLGAGTAEGDVDGGLPTPGEEDEIAVQLGEAVECADEEAMAQVVVQIREAMAECLGLSRQDIGCMRSFWDLGAESMDAVRLLDACERKGLHLALRDMFDSPTAAALAGRCKVGA
ncbi:nonribosomal peptide synthase 2 [Diplodia corticola]|uniref:Nonribosomal peptide synthase 2 n=1 Tax=Diplodia corticola TaxID=236234 RepID=A0A1J9RSD9_9PEZI|nr:nonribosomal peptide synthase 2 [Diplodia corticola]OJD30437.1 nonribosomal peptide synthase 2 [Diplodia corticola]